MKEQYVPGNFKWIGRIDGDTKDYLRWHQVIENIDLSKDKPNKSGVCILGFKSDLGVRRNKGRVGAKKAPDIIRKYLASLPWHFDEVGLYDAGDVVSNDSLENAQELLSNKMKTIFNMNLFPVVIGGGHEVAFGSIIGAYKYFGSMPSIINFDAHFDMRDYNEGATSGTSFKQIADICKNKGETFKYCCIGIQRASNIQVLFDYARKYKVDWIDAEIISFKEKDIFIKLDDLMDKFKNIHLTVCMDVFAQSVAPGVSNPQPFGLTTKEFLKLFLYVLKSNKIKSFDIAEVSPPLDVDNKTSMLAAHIIFKLLERVVFKYSSVSRPTMIINNPNRPA